MKTEELHDALVAALTNVGGLRAEEIVDPKAPHADVVFPDFSAIIEVKSLTEDRALRSEIRELAGEMLKKSGKMIGKENADGSVSYEISELDDCYAAIIFKALSSRISKEVSNANKQIKSTAESLDEDFPVRIIIFIVPAHFSTHNGVILTAIQHKLESGDCGTISGIAIIAVPVEEKEGAEGHISFYAREGSDGFPKPLQELIAKAWVNEFDRRTEKLSKIDVRSTEEFEQRFLSRRVARLGD